jgi:hypothetical protein
LSNHAHFIFRTGNCPYKTHEKVTYRLCCRF